jgi:hypothetical protein
MILNLSQYKEHGFLLCKGLFAAGEIARVHGEAKKIFAMQMLRRGFLLPGEVSEADFSAGMFRLFEFDLPAFMNCGRQAQHLISLHRLSLDDRILAALKELGLPFPNIGMRLQPPSACPERGLLAAAAASGLAHYTGVAGLGSCLDTACRCR